MAKIGWGCHCPVGRGCGLSLARGPNGSLKSPESTKGWRPPTAEPSPGERRTSRGAPGYGYLN
eukprot:6314416-Alexandrium_andersonii.AAC.1